MVLILQISILKSRKKRKHNHKKNTLNQLYNKHLKTSKHSTNYEFVECFAFIQPDFCLILHL